MRAYVLKRDSQYPTSIYFIFSHPCMNQYIIKRKSKKKTVRIFFFIIITTQQWIEWSAASAFNVYIVWWIKKRMNGMKQKIKMRKEEKKTVEITIKMLCAHANRIQCVCNTLNKCAFSCFMCVFFILLDFFRLFFVLFVGCLFFTVCRLLLLRFHIKIGCFIYIIRTAYTHIASYINNIYYEWHRNEKLRDEEKNYIFIAATTTTNHSQCNMKYSMAL